MVGVLIMKDELNQVFSSFKGKEDELISILQSIQEKFGYLSKDSMQETAKFVSVPESKVFGVATFYAQFRFKSIGKKHITVCRGTSCHVKDAVRILEEIERQLGIKEGETTKDKEYSLETVACIGCCGLSPCILINDKVEAKVTSKKIIELFGNQE